jgi:hypothetical protein
LYVLQVPPKVQARLAKVEVVVLDTEDREIKDSRRGVTDFGEVIIAVKGDVEVELLIWDVG